MSTLEDWVEELAGALELDPSVVDTRLLLDLARDAAHGVARPAAPLTTFLVGLAAGKQGGDARAVRWAVDAAQRLAAARGDDPLREVHERDAAAGAAQPPRAPQPES